MNITSVQGKKIIRKGDTTTTGGSVLAGAPSAEHNAPIARKGDIVFCPACNSTGKITEGSFLLNIDDIPVALEEHKVSCNCSGGCVLVSI